MTYYPQKVVWEITYSCNINCIHCGSDCTAVEKNYQLTTAECMDVIDDLSKLGCELVIFSGGEPLMRKDIGALAAAVRMHKMKVAFISNGYLLNEKNIKMIKSVHPAAYGLSIDSCRGYIHDYIRGKKGVFDGILRAIKLLQENDIPVSVVTTVHKLNFEDLQGLREFMIDHNIRLWQVQFADAIGRMPRESMLTEAQYMEMAKFILETKTKYGKYFSAVSGADAVGYMGDLGTKLQGPWYGCFAGLKALGLGSDGSVRGCLSLQMDEFIEGNVRERSLIDIWNDKNAFAYNRHFDCSSLTGHCADCVYATVCKGGCTRAAVAQGGRCNPYCLYQMEENGFSSEEQAKIHFSKEEIAAIYNPVRPLPPEFFN